MQLTVRELIDKRAAIEKLLTAELPFKLAYRLQRLTMSLVSEFKIIEKVRREIVEKYSKKEQGKLIVIPEKANDFSKEFDAFMEETVEIEITKIPQECLAEIKLSAMDLLNLKDFIEEQKKGKER